MGKYVGKEDVFWLRNEFLTKMEELGPRLFHPADVSRVKTDDEYLLRFLKHSQDKKAALKMLCDTCAWRISFGVNDINEDNVNQTILKSGSIFPHGKDIDGKTLLIFKSKLHHKDAHEFEDQKKCLVYWLERLEREGKGDMISLFFDMDGASMGNMDIDYTLYLINLFKCYYPYFLNYIIVFEMAWVLNAMFKIIKSWLPPEAVEKLKFVDKSTVKNFVNEDDCLVSWGGKNAYVFGFKPSKKTPAPVEEGDDVREKKVHFDEASLENDKLSESRCDESATPKIKFKIFPPDTMLFSGDGDDAISSIMVKNEDSRYISYKIKTTSPGKFAVRPSLGVLSPDKSAVINIVLLHGHSLQSLQRDKFLIMYIPVDRSNHSSEELADLWRTINEKEVDQWKLRCFMPQSASHNASFSGNFLVGTSTVQGKKVLLSLSSDVAALNVYSENLKKEMAIIRKQQWAILCSIILVLLSLWYFMYTDRSCQPFSQNCWTESDKL